MKVTVMGIISNIIGIPLALLAIKVIRDYASVEHLLNEDIDDSLLTDEYIETPLQVE